MKSKHTIEWKERQRRLEHIIKREYYSHEYGKVENLFETNPIHTGGGYVSWGYGISIDEELNEIVPEPEIGDRINQDTYMNTNNEYDESIILIITEYVKKEHILDQYVKAYEKLYEQLEYFYKDISNKSDIDRIIEQVFLKKKYTNHMYSANKANPTTQEIYKGSQNLKNHSMKNESAQKKKEEEADIEMDTYTVSVVLKIKKYILNTFPMLHNIISNLKCHHNDIYYISNRIGLIEGFKKKIYDQCCEKKRNIQNYIYNNSLQQQSSSRMMYQYENKIKETSYEYTRYNVQSTSSNISRDEKLISCKSISNPGSVEPSNVQLFHQLNSNYTDGIQNQGSNVSNLQLYPSISKQSACTKFYEIKITTDKNLISLKSILLLIEIVLLLHDYFLQCEIENRMRQNNINWQCTPKETMDQRKHTLFSNIILGKMKKNESMELSHNISTSSSSYTLSDYVSYSEPSGTAEIISKRNSDASSKPNEALKNGQWKESHESFTNEELYESSTISRKQIDALYEYTRELFMDVLEECDISFIIEFLYTLHIFQFSFLFKEFKELLLKYPMDNEAILMFTYCAYKTQNKEMIEYCFWKLVNLFENDQIPQSWMSLQKKHRSFTNPINSTNNYLNQSLAGLNAYGLVQNYSLLHNSTFTKSKEETIRNTKQKAFCSSIFYDTLHIIEQENDRNISEIDPVRGNLYFKKNLIDKNLFSNIIHNIKRDFEMNDSIPDGYVINEVKRIRNFSEFYSCCFLLRNNKKEKILMAFKKKGENKVYIYKYDKYIKKKHKNSKMFFHISGFLGVLVTSFTGMEIKIYDNGINEKYANFFSNFKRNNIIKIKFESNIISELPRHFICNIYKENRLMKIIYENKCPVWNEEKEIYELPFYGRVGLASAKNLQLTLKKCVVKSHLKNTFENKSINDIVEYVIWRKKEQNNGINKNESNHPIEYSSSVEIQKNPNQNVSKQNNTNYVHTEEKHSSKETYLQRGKKKLSFENVKTKLTKANNKCEIINKDQEEIFLIFGKNSKDSFTLDFRHPLSTFEAFAIAISSLLKKKAVS